MKIGVLGGSFDPPHFGHLLIAQQTKDILKLDEVWLMPYYAHNWDKTIAKIKDRLAMTKLLEKEGIITSDEEIHLHQKSYTINTVRRLKSKYHHTFYWIIGSDTLFDFRRWKESKKLLKETNFLVFPRSGHPIPEHLDKSFIKVNSSNMIITNISSTIVRDRLIYKQSVSGIVPDKVLKYIKDHKLYST